jgi:YD repeat-containing protein
MRRALVNYENLNPALNDVSYGTTFRYVVRQREVSGQPGYRSTQTFYDGWGRSIQTKRESQDLAQTIVTDTRYDAAGNTVAQSQPRYVTETGAAFGSYTLPPASVHWTTSSFDALQRPLAVTQPDGAIQRHRYFLQGGLLLHDTVDAKRHRTVTRSDRWGRRVQVDEFAGTCSNAWSAYACAAPFTTAWSIAGSTSYRYTLLNLPPLP